MFIKLSYSTDGHSAYFRTCRKADDGDIFCSEISTITLDLLLKEFKENTTKYRVFERLNTNGPVYVIKEVGV